MDPYDVLQIGRNATAEQVKAAYRARLREVHPDSSTTEGHASDVDAIVGAYQSIVASVVAQPEGSTNHSGAGFHADLQLDAQPRAAFELLTLAASWFGDPFDTDPPNAMSILWTSDPAGYVHLTLTHTNGSANVRITTSERLKGVQPPTPTQAADALLSAIAELDEPQ
jgi:hypothetical protein